MRADVSTTRNGEPCCTLATLTGSGARVCVCALCRAADATGEGLDGAGLRDGDELRSLLRLLLIGNPQIECLTLEAELQCAVLRIGQTGRGGAVLTDPPFHPFAAFILLAEH